MNKVVQKHIVNNDPRHSVQKKNLSQLLVFCAKEVDKLLRLLVRWRLDIRHWLNNLYMQRIILQ